MPSQVKMTQGVDQPKSDCDRNRASDGAKKPRYKTSTACAACRERRIRCVLGLDESKCAHCARTGAECIIRADDERKRPTSKAYTNSLTNRIQLLEQMLIERGEEPPPIVYPPKTKNGAPTTTLEPVLDAPDRSRKRSKSNDSSSSGRPNIKADRTTSFNSLHRPDAFDDGIMADFNKVFEHPSADLNHYAVNAPSPPKDGGLMSKILSTQGHLSFDSVAGQQRYYGPTTNCHIYSQPRNTFGNHVQESPDQIRRTEKIIRSISQETHDYLMNNFWTCYNSVLHVIHEAAFHENRENRESRSNQYYSGFLHICILAMGYRFADKNREDMKRMKSPDMECSLHREAKFMLDGELERPGGIASIQALLLLGDLECGVGRDNTGWMYAGMACRLAFDIGLHLDCRRMGLPESEVEIRDMTLWACVVYDKYWALFLGRPTTMKSSDLEVYQLTKQFARLGTCMPAGPSKSLETQIYEALLDLMELAGKITEIGGSLSPNSQNFSHEMYTRVSALDAELSRWHSRLPLQLRWTNDNIHSAPFSFFLLHQQYHCTVILLHRPFALYNGPSVQPTSTDSDISNSFSNNDHEQQHDSLFSTLSRNVCTTHAIQISRIFWQHRQRFDTSQIFVTGIQHAGTAAVSIIAALSYLNDPAERRSHMQYLECLAAALSDMTDTYKPAESMSAVLKSVMEELQEGLEGYAHMNGTVIPARRGSTIEDDVDAAAFRNGVSNKRRQGSGSGQRERGSDASHDGGLSASPASLSLPNSSALSASGALSFPVTPPSIPQHHHNHNQNHNHNHLNHNSHQSQQQLHSPSGMLTQPYDPLYEFIGNAGISGGWMGLDQYDHVGALKSPGAGGVTGAGGETAGLPPNYNQELDETLDFFAVMAEDGGAWGKG